MLIWGGEESSILDFPGL